MSRAIEIQSKSGGKVGAIERKNVVWSFLLIVAAFWLCSANVGLKEAVVSGLVMALSCWLILKATPLFNFKRVTILSFWYLTYLAMIFFPAFVVYADEQDPYRGRFLLAVHATLIAVPIGYLLANWWFRFNADGTERFFQGETLLINRPKRLRRIFLFLLVISLFLSVLYIRSVDVIPLFYLLRNPGDYMQVALLREDSFKLLDSPYLYAFYVLRSVIFPFLVIVSLGCYLRTKEKVWRNLFLATSAAALFYCSLSAAKLPVAAIVAVIGFFIYYYGKGIVSRRTVAIVLICLLVFPLGIILTAYQGLDTVGEALYVIFGRLCYTPSEVLYYYFEAFPHFHPFLWGRSIDKFARLMGMAPFNTDRYVGAFAARPGDGPTVSFNAAFIGNLYADFGFAGVVVGGAVAGFIMSWFHVLVVRRRKTVSSIALYAFLAFTFWMLNSTSLPVVLASNGALLVTVVAWWLDRPLMRGVRGLVPSATVAVVR